MEEKHGFLLIVRIFGSRAVKKIHFCASVKLISFHIYFVGSQNVFNFQLFAMRQQKRKNKCEYVSSKA
jgi:hypothetical protein